MLHGFIYACSDKSKQSSVYVIPEKTVTTLQQEGSVRVYAVLAEALLVD